MKITFKDVGQGDSIIIEWLVDGEEKLGIIDCKRYNKTNPIVLHLQKIKWVDKPIDFIILSHPHIDHYSGMKELLIYCQKNKVTIKRFGYNFPSISNMLDATTDTWPPTQSRIGKLMDEVKTMLSNGKIVKRIIPVKLPNKTMRFPLNPNKTINLECLSPTNKELTNFQQKLDSIHNQGSNASISKVTNQIATIFSLRIEDGEEPFQVLFTSDATTESFDHVTLNEMEKLRGRRLILAQIPHHGSIKNHQISFWRNLNREVNTPAVISAGEHGHYNHPHKEVIEGFEKYNYKVYSTNHVNGMKDFLNSTSQKRSDILDTHNTKQSTFPPKPAPGDQIFEIKYGAALYSS